MKRFLFLILLTAFSLLASATPLYFNTTAFTIRILPDGKWSQWEKVTIPFSINAETKHIEILSQEPQVFDYTGFESTSFDGGIVYGSYATDKNSLTVYIELYLYTSGLVYFNVEYSDVEYKYKLEDY